jgi:ADP-ribosylglycohydrolase/fructose-1,6-bisphosphatase/inositol monophosphatase family enzyme
MPHDMTSQRRGALVPAAVLPAVVDAVREAGAMLRAEFHRPRGPRGQGGHAPVDAEIERRLRERLLPLGEAGWLGEETGRTLARSAFTWVVDPNDGTRAFLKRLRGFSVSVALLRAGRPVLGVVFAPTAPDDGGDLIAWAEGTVLTRNGAAVARPAVERTALTWDSVVAMNERAADYAAANASRLAPARFVAVPSVAYRLALAAAGEIDAGIGLVAGLAPWDVAGGHALLIGAGRTLVDLGGAPIAYCEGASYHGCIGAAPDLAAALVARDLSAAVGRGYAPRHPARLRVPVAVAQTLSRAHGVLLGQLVGDALGSAVEFLGAGEIRRRHPEGVRDLTPGGTWNLIAGQPTDDGEMALALARSLVAEGALDAAAVGRAYVDWRRSGPFDIGGTTRAGITAIAAGAQAVSDSQANGALMRVSPIGYCAAIATGVAGADAETMWALAHAHAGEGPGADAVRARLEAARDRGPDSFETNQGWVLTALHNAFRWLLSGAPLEHAMVATVASGGDTDTTAAICGALLGAAQGREAVPLRWRRLVLSCRPLPGPGVVHPRPPVFWPDDALDLAEALLAAGRGAPA